jgi:hypothetical protein
MPTQERHLDRSRYLSNLDLSRIPQVIRYFFSLDYVIYYISQVINGCGGEFFG